MGIEIATYAPDFERREQDLQYRKGFEDGVQALKSRLLDDYEELGLELANHLETLQSSLLMDPPLLSLPEDWLDTMRYVQTLPLFQKRFLLGTWKNERVYVSLNCVAERQRTMGLDCSEFAIACIGATEETTQGSCIGSIKGTGTGLIVLEDRCPEGPLQSCFFGVQRALGVPRG